MSGRAQSNSFFKSNVDQCQVERSRDLNIIQNVK